MLLATALLFAFQSSAAPAPLRSADAAFRAGYAAINAGDLATAERNFAQAARLAPKIAAAHSAYGAVLLQEGKLDAAAEQLRLAESLDATDAAALLNLALAEAALAGRGGSGAAHHVGEARAAAGRWQALTGKPLPIDATQALATAAIAAGDRAGALAVVQSSLAASDAGDHAQRSLLLDLEGTLLAQERRYAEAVPPLREATAEAPDRPQPHLHLGAALLALHDVSGMAELTEAARLAPDDDVIALQLGKAQIAASQYADARATLERLHLRTPGDVDATYQLGLVLEALNDPKTAIPLFETALAQRPQDASLLINLALAMVQTGRAKEAIPLYRRAEAVDPNNPVLREDLGVAYLQQNDLDGALREFRAGAALDPKSAQLAYDLGLALKLRDDLPGAIAMLQHAAALDPALADAPYTLGVIYMQQGRFEESAQSLRAAIALRPDDGDMWAMLGSVHKQAGQNTEAIEALRRAITIQPGQPGNHINLAAVLAQTGDRTGAAAERKVAADLSRSAVNHQKAAFALDSGKLLRSRGQLAEAEVQLRAAVAADPGSRDAHTALAELLLQQGKVTEAQAERDRANATAVLPPSSP